MFHLIRPAHPPKLQILRAESAAGATAAARENPFARFNSLIGPRHGAQMATATFEIKRDHSSGQRRIEVNDSLIPVVHSVRWGSLVLRMVVIYLILAFVAVLGLSLAAAATGYATTLLVCFWFAIVLGGVVASLLELWREPNEREPGPSVKRNDAIPALKDRAVSSTFTCGSPNGQPAYGRYRAVPHVAYLNQKWRASDEPYVVTFPAEESKNLDLLR